MKGVAVNKRRPLRKPRVDKTNSTFNIFDTPFGCLGVEEVAFCSSPTASTVSGWLLSPTVFSTCGGGGVGGGRC